MFVLQSDSDLRVESFSEDEAGGDTPETEPSAGTPAEIRTLGQQMNGHLLLGCYAPLDKKRRNSRTSAKLNEHTILRETVVSVEIEVKPHYLVPDTNCFIDYLPQLQKISQATTSQHQLLYTLMVPLVGE
ncbi:unnamed protein product [Timema podura]|uniref:PIN domain-containing protein n=1 Tax=Timema podura TaxID=61482 RepID=A0ABN7PNG8_TIMPD|nr:unnamed protein product [Timema podura]